MSLEKKPDSVSVGIVAMAHNFPPYTRTVKDVFQDEGVSIDSRVDDEIGINQVHVFDGEWKSDLALAAAKECLLRAGLQATEIDVIVDFSSLPQDYVVPSWCMSNKIQHELGARNAFNLGFGGGGATSLLVALKFVSFLIKTDDDVKTALLIASDVSIPGNRVINSQSPMTVLGDGASAVIVTMGTGVCEIIGAELCSDGDRHDVFYIPGGGLAHPDRLDLYRLEVRPEKYSAISAFEALEGVSQKVTQRSGVSLHEVSNFVGPNVSTKNQALLAKTLGFSNKDPFKKNRQKYGHVQATDLVVNLSEVLESRSGRSRELGLVCSDGWGFLSGAMLVKH
jgi:3-oxoacyl-[acyl-carrier-protein] synthase III